MSEILIEGFSAEEAFKALCENNEASLSSSDDEYYIVIANELGFDLEFYAKPVNRAELVSEITRYIELDRFNTTADILLGLQEDEFEKSIEDLCMAAAGEAYLEDVGILIKNKAGKVISGIDFTLSLIDELQDYEAGEDVIQKLKTQQPFTFIYERDINDYGDFVVEGVDFKEAFQQLRNRKLTESPINGTGEMISYNNEAKNLFHNVERMIQVGSPVDGIYDIIMNNLEEDITYKAQFYARHGLKLNTLISYYQKCIDAFTNAFPNQLQYIQALNNALSQIQNIINITPSCKK